MTTSVESLLAELGVEAPRLLEARARTAARLARRRELLAQADLGQDIAAVFVGSWGRQEVTTGSDNDYYVLTRRLGNRAAEANERVKSALLSEESAFREPGREGIFGDVVSLPGLLENIGLDRDTNTNLTQRMLLVLESVAVHNAALHEEARGTVISTYLEEPIKACQPPRLFLNDVVRYWRTMCVDFAGKMMDRGGEGWGLRNAKLRTTRKMLFASGLLPLLRCYDLESAEIEPFLRAQFERPPADRVADAFATLGLRAAAARVFTAYEGFLVHMESAETRSALDAIKGRPEADESKLFQRVARHGNDIEAGLLELLFETPLSATTRRYGIF